MFQYKGIIQSGSQSGSAALFTQTVGKCCDFDVVRNAGECKSFHCSYLDIKIKTIFNSI